MGSLAALRESLPCPVRMEWRKIRAGDERLLQKYFTLMSEMDPHYASADLESCMDLISRQDRSYFWGEAGADCACIGLVWNASIECDFVENVGFSEGIAVHQAVNLIIDKGASYLEEVGRSSLATIVPDRMRNPRILQFYDVLLWHPGLKIRGGHYVSHGKYWKLSPKL